MGKPDKWFSAKCVFAFLSERTKKVEAYEERIIVIRAKTSNTAIEKAEVEAKKYCRGTSRIKYTGFASVYEMYDYPGRDGAEIYSLVRKSRMKRDRFVTKYYDDGTECTRKYPSDRGG